ncbi:(2Fe-2S)-binding protein [Shewanella sp. GXUN23E]|uniref:(2Fe-2S)-binding protein n=1 Tax=Shewanella sp. GXUN23E TaxID=3422498 RepID=UPI003D7E9A36
MYVCICHAVTDSQIKQAIAEGACTLSELKATLEIGNTCGKCLKQTGQLIKAEINARANYYEAG